MRIEMDTSFNMEDGTSTGVQKLAQAVLWRAVQDVKEAVREKDRVTAKAFLLGGDYLPFWCAAAGLREEVVQEWARKL